MIKLNVNMAHDRLGHFGESMLRKTYKDLKITLTGTLYPCDGCLCAKACQKNVQKDNMKKLTIPGECLYVDTSGPYPPSIHGSKYWGKVVDECTNFSWDYFLKEKSDFPKKVLNLIDSLINKGYIIKYLRCDNAGEFIMTLKEGCNKYRITMKFMALYTLQHNGVVEQCFVTDRDRALTMLFWHDWKSQPESGYGQKP